MCENTEKNEVYKGEVNMGNAATIKYPETYPENRKSKICESLKEVELMQAGKLPIQTARDFLNESRNK